tara:strand:+ start:135 stop:788 length:654 start_codon:yes stop_codon:yes gene_type:complete
MKKNNNIKIIIFDFDGVIINTHSIKSKVFCELYKSFGIEIVNKIKKYQLINGGVNRFKKFKFFHEKFLKKKFTKKVKLELNKKFNLQYLSKLKKIKISENLLNFLKNSSSYNLYISSAAPRKEIFYILEKFELKKYFKKVYSSNQSKEKHIQQIKKKEKMENSNYLFIGDMISDYTVAEKSKINFIHFNKYNRNKIRQAKFLINDFHKLKRAIDKFN